MTHRMTLLVIQLAVIIVSAKVLGYVFSRYLKQPRVLGELAAGMAIGPYALGALEVPILQGALFPLAGGTLPIAPELYGFATVASIVLLFLAGLETDLPTFLRFSATGSAIGLGGAVVSFVLGDLAAVFFLPGIESFMDPPALFLGTLATATSVGITARILSERRKMSSPEGVTILAAAVLDDVLGIVVLAIVVGIAKVRLDGGTVEWGRIGIIAAKAFGFWIGCTVIGILIAPRLTKGLKRFRSMDMVTTVAFGIALFLAGLSELAGLAMIIGAYVTGLALSQTDVAHELRENLQGLYSFLVPVFFCVMGMLVDFSALRGVLVFGLIYSAGAIAGKFLGAGIPAYLAGFTLRGSFRIGAGMQPRGEVTLIVAGIGLSAGAIGQDLFGVAIMTLLISTVAAPPLLIASFRGAAGYRKEVPVERPRGLTTHLELPLPSEATADFIRGRLLSAFRHEEFFVNRIGVDRPLYHVRKDEILIIVAQDDRTITVTTGEEHSQFVKLLVLEELVDLTDLLDGLKQIGNPGRLGQNLAEGLFDAP
jgi:Kef-type K+ transport system membrane component KefB